MKKYLAYTARFLGHTAEQYAPAIAMILAGALDYATGWFESVSAGAANPGSLAVVGGVLLIGRLTRSMITTAKVMAVAKQLEATQVPLPPVVLSDTPIVVGEPPVAHGPPIVPPHVDPGAPPAETATVTVGDVVARGY